MALLAFLLVFLLGFANQRGSTCAVAAADEIVSARSFHRIAGFGVAAAISAAFLSYTGSSPRLAATSGLGSILGGIIGAIGASLNGRCAMGTIASLGRGRLDRIGSLFGFYLGALVVLRLAGWTATETILASHMSLRAALIAALFAVAAWFLARDRGLATPGWMALIGLLNAVFIWRMTDWSYTGGLTRLAAGSMVDQAAFWGFLLAMIAGSLVAAQGQGTLRLQISSPNVWFRSGFGGLLLGVGSALVPGSNDTMLLVGVPLLVPGLLLAYASFWITLLVLRRQPMRPEPETAVEKD